MILRKETETFQLYQPMIELQKQQIRMNDTPQGDGNVYVAIVRAGSACP